MRIAVLPLSAVEHASAALARQLPNFASDVARTNSNAEVNGINLMSQVEQNGMPRAALVNLDGLLEEPMLKDLFQQTQVDRVIDGSLQKAESGPYHLRLRAFANGTPEPVSDETFDFLPGGVFPVLRAMIKLLLEMSEAEVTNDFKVEDFDFGTDKPEAFLKFLEGYDAIAYIQQANGQVVLDFDPSASMDALLDAITMDADFEGAFQALVALCRACANFRIGSADVVIKTLNKLKELRPNDFEAFFALGEVYQAMNDPVHASDEFEKSIQRKNDDPALYSRLGLSQLAAGMPVNAERNFRKAMELEGPDKPSAQYLEMVLAQTNRAHEIPPIWKELVDQDPQNGQARVRYALALAQNDKKEEAKKVFEDALETLEEKTVVKRFYAPLLAQEEDFDRAMDFYEDVLDENPTDVAVLLEYARTLAAADRTFEVPQVLKTVLASNPDVNTRAQVLAWQIEIEQPKRVEAVQEAEKKMEAGDHEGAVRDLKPLRTWLADYWKMWLLLSHAQNELGQWKDAEESVQRLLELFPACEPGYSEILTSLSEQDRAAEAYQIMRIASANMPQSVTIGVNLALAAYRSGSEEEGRKIAAQIREAVGANDVLEQVLSEIR